jgi:ATP-dependent DNA helicase RecG
MTIKELKTLKESENKVEFKEAKGGSFSFNGGSRIEPKERRRCILGYTIAFANEGGGNLVLGMSDKYPHLVVETEQSKNAVGKLEQDIYTETRIRVKISELFEADKRVVVISVPSRNTPGSNPEKPIQKLSNNSR